MVLGGIGQDGEFGGKYLLRGHWLKLRGILLAPQAHFTGRFWTAGGMPSRGLHGQLLSECVQEVPEILSPVLDPMTARFTFCRAKGIPRLKLPCLVFSHVPG